MKCEQEICRLFTVLNMYSKQCFHLFNVIMIYIYFCICITFAKYYEPKFIVLFRKICVLILTEKLGATVVCTILLPLAYAITLIHDDQILILSYLTLKLGHVLNESTRCPFYW